MISVVGFAGHSHAGKTSLIEQLIRLDVISGRLVGVLKHTHHPNLPPSSRGDTERFLSAGAVEVMLAGSSAGYRFDSSRSRIVFSFEDPDALPGQFGDRVDRIYIEGYKNTGNWPRVIVDHAGLADPPDGLPRVAAAVTDRASIFPSLPTFTHDQVEALRAFLDRMPLP